LVLNIKFSLKQQNPRKTANPEFMRRLELPLGFTIQRRNVDALWNVDAVGQDVDVLQWSLNAYQQHHNVTLLLLLLLHPLNGHFSRTTWVSRHHKGKPF